MDLTIWSDVHEVLWIVILPELVEVTEQFIRSLDFFFGTKVSHLDGDS